MMRASSCPTKLYVNVNVEVADQKKTLTIFDDILKATLGELDDQSVDTIAKQLLLLDYLAVISFPHSSSYYVLHKPLYFTRKLV